MQAPIEVSRREGEVFLLDILSHRMSAIAIYRQLKTIAGGLDYFRLADQPPSDEPILGL